MLTTNAVAGTPAENAVQAETTGGFSASVLTPSRIQASFYYSREDRARFSGMGEALRMNLTDALADKVDQQILVGTEGLFTGTKLANHNVSAATSYANYRSELAYGRVDGTFAGSVSDLKIVMGAASYGHAAGAFRSANAGDRPGPGRPDAGHRRRKSQRSRPRRGWQQAECRDPAGYAPGYGGAGLGGRDADSGRNHQGGQRTDCHSGRAVGAAHNIMIIAEAAAIIANLGENPRQDLRESWC